MNDALTRASGVIEALSPGLYFQRCLPIWEEGLTDSIAAKAQAMGALAGQSGPSLFVRGDVALHAAVLDRQRINFEMLGARGDALEFRIRNLTPFVTGIGQPHPLETGFAFLKPYGVPYLAASGVKGPVRAACGALWKEACGQTEAGARLRHYFGSDDEAPRKDVALEHRRGALIFFDLFPTPPDQKGWAEAFRVDLVNPHYAEYYQGKDVPPADWHRPVPSNFLTLRDGLEWRLRLVYAPRGEPRAAWRDEVTPGLLGALGSQGLGAKKSWAYGLFEIADATSLKRSGAAALSTPSHREDAEPPSAPSTTRVSPAAASLRLFIDRLRPQEARSQIDRIRGDLARCTDTERTELLALLDRRLREWRWKERDVRDLRSRLTAPQREEGPTHG